jgi:hypothetical protein
MKTLFKTTVLALFLAVLSGCATNQSVTGSRAGDGGLLGAGVGAGVGALVAQTVGLPSAAGALVGGALGGGVGYYVGHTQDVEIAEANAKKWTADGFQTKTQASLSEVKGQSGEQLQKLDKVDIDIPAQMLKTKSPALTNLLIDAGKMSSESKYRYIYQIHAKSEKDADYLLSKIKTGAAPKDIIHSWVKADKPKLVMEVLPT